MVVPKTNARICVIKEIELEVEEITLLSIAEYEKAKAVIPFIKDRRWWLKSPGTETDYSVAYIDRDGSVNTSGADACGSANGVRPALRVRDLTSPKGHWFILGDKVEIAGKSWTVISDNLVLCDEIVESLSFCMDWKDSDANVYDTSDVKKWLDEWAAENHIRFVN